MAPAPHRPRAFCKVTVAGIDITTNIVPRLLNLTVIDRVGGQNDECHIEIDDRYGETKLPNGADPIAVELGWPEEGTNAVFDGLITDIESAGQKQGGRTVTVSAHGQDTLKGLSKGIHRWSVGDGTTDVPLKDALEQAAKLAGGMDMRIDAELAKVTRKFWMANNESFTAFGQRMAEELGGTFKISGNIASFSKLGSFASVDGKSLFVVLARTGVNLLAWRICPMVSNPQWANTGHMHFDPMKATWNLVQKSIAGTLATADWTGVGPVADKDTAQQQADSHSVLSAGQRGTGWVAVDGEPKAKAGGQVVIDGAREGVDGPYYIEAVEHTYNAQTGFTTRMDVSKLGVHGVQEIK